MTWAGGEQDGRLAGHDRRRKQTHAWERAGDGVTTRMCTCVPDLRMLTKIQELVASLVAISPKTPDHTLSLVEKRASGFPGVE